MRSRAKAGLDARLWPFHSKQEPSPPRARPRLGARQHINSADFQRPQRAESRKLSPASRNPRSAVEQLK
jgi:hypothetical protein